jgi:hypothetical protein
MNKAPTYQQADSGSMSTSVFVKNMEMLAESQTQVLDSKGTIDAILPNLRILMKLAGAAKRDFDEAVRAVEDVDQLDAGKTKALEGEVDAAESKLIAVKDKLEAAKNDLDAAIFTWEEAKSQWVKMYEKHLSSCQEQWQ